MVLLELEKLLSLKVGIFMYKPKYKRINNIFYFSFIVLACELKLDICMLNLTHEGISDASLAEYLRDAPKARCDTKYNFFSTIYSHLFLSILFMSALLCLRTLMLYL